MRKRGAGVHGVWCGVAGIKGGESLFAVVNHFSYSHCDCPVFTRQDNSLYLNKQQDRTERNQASYWRLYKGGQLISLGVGFFCLLHKRLEDPKSQTFFGCSIVPPTLT